jgi:GTP-binding protein
MFVDEVDILVEAGHGGAGCMSFRREKFIPRGGPDGGDGGKGGSVYAVASPHINTLVSFRFNREFHARRGGHGEGSNRTGKDAPDIELEVPVGTLIYQKPDDPAEPTVQIGDLVEAGQRVLLAQGGIGGRGNARFVSSTNRAPRRCEEGIPGETRQLQLHLKLLADVGLVGFPNAGKSTLISRISAARPKIAAYPFTTLIPNLGVVSLSGNRSFVVADVPGLIEGAHEGRGLGDRFLKHLDRTKVLVHLVDVSGASGRDPIEDFETIQRELAAFSTKLAAKPQIVAATKMDAVGDADAVDTLEAHVTSRNLPFLRISAVTGERLAELQEAIWKYLTPIAEVESRLHEAEVVTRRAAAQRLDTAEAESGPIKAEVVARRARTRTVDSAEAEGERSKAEVVGRRATARKADSAEADGGTSKAEVVARRAGARRGTKK